MRILQVNDIGLWTSPEKSQMRKGGKKGNDKKEIQSKYDVYK